MSAFKFACPVCGQHITCDSSSSGAQMDCPTCFRKLIVPQATASGSGNFVLTAAAVQNRPASTLENGPGGPTASASQKKFPVMAVIMGGLFVCAAAGAAIFVLTKNGKNPDPDSNGKIVAANTNATPKLMLSPRSAEATNWTLVLAEAKIPDTPANGAVNGFGFKLERATIQGGKLDLRQGPKWPPDVGLSIHLYADRPQDLAGRTVVLEATRTNAPSVILRWKDAQSKAVTREFKQGYAARVEFGQVTNNRLNGKIYLAAPDDQKSYAAGTFSAEIRKPNPPKK